MRKTVITVITEDLASAEIGSTVTLTSQDGSYTWSWIKQDSELLPGTFAWFPSHSGMFFHSEWSSKFLASKIVKIPGDYQIER